MSNSDDVATLTARIQEYEKRENALKEKVKQEHAQVLNFQKKLAQAGSHLKTLTQENSKLSNTLTQLKQEKLETQEGHQKELKQLVEILESTLEDKAEFPDVSNSTLVDSYIKSVQKRLKTNNKKSNKVQELETKIQQLQKEIKELQATDTIEKIEKSLKSILNDPENGSLETTVPPSIYIILEQVRDALQAQQEKLEIIQKNHAVILEETQRDLKRQVTQLQMTLFSVQEEKEKNLVDQEKVKVKIDQLTQEKTQVEKILIETREEKRASQEREQQLAKDHSALLGKLSHIKETLAPRLEQDKQLRQRVSELTADLDRVQQTLEQSRHEMMLREDEHSEQIERAERVQQELSAKLERVQAEREEFEVLANQLDAQCQSLQEEKDGLEGELEYLKSKMASEQLDNESERASLANLQSVLEEFQATKDVELKAAVEHIERQLDVAKKSWAEYEERAHIAEAALEKYQKDVKRTEKYDQELKEKNLLIGKLRHEAIILNEHLVEAMRKLKEETSESNVDRQLITNLLIGFFNAPRGDRKRFDILTIISNVLQLSEEQKEQIGLVRPKQGQPNPNLSPTLDQPQKESFTDAWISFLLKESSPLRRNRSAVTLSNVDQTTEL